MSARTPLAALDAGQLRQELTAMGVAGYRADQIRLHAWRGSANTFLEMGNLPAQLRQKVDAHLLWSSLETVATSVADRGLTEKLLLRAADGQEVEAVMIRHRGTASSRARNTVCVSSQVGCAIGCVFCATGQLGLRRNLSAAEIVDQVLEASRRWASQGFGPATNVVYMGMGEPLQNYEAVVSSIRLLQEWGVSPRRVVVSTSGLVPQIDQLAQEHLPIRLALSLHAASDELRNRLVPLNRRYPIETLMEAAIGFVTSTGRRVSLEYVLIAGVNDSLQDAAALRRLAARVSGHVNLIPMNHIPASNLTAPSTDVCRNFAQAVGPRATIRFSRGDRATAACGQLRASMDADQRRVARAASASGLGPPSAAPPALASALPGQIERDT
ncbi:MAG: 23S rRNA (adenine(2503)-C(2))-methyltransferase RlmN [Candidatus Dormibacteria bacterium]